jgi:hypothetical protein
LPDIICYHYDDGVTYWYENNGSGTSWTKHEIYGAAFYWKGIGDVDHDSDIDIISYGYWYINPTYTPQLGYWKLDEGEGTTAGDSSPTGGNDGTIYGGETWVDGKIGKALEFDGANDYVAIDNFVYDEAGQIDKITVMAWIETTDTNNAIIDWDSSEYWSLGVDFAGTVGTGKISWNTSGETEGTHNLGSTGTVNDGDWHHIAVTYDSADGKKEIYIDGEPDNSATAYSAGENLGTSVTRYGFIGDGSEASTFNGDRNNLLFEGIIDEVRVLRRALSADEIYYDHYQRIAASLPMDEGEGSVIYDETSNYNDGTIYGATWTTGKIGYGLDFDGTDDYVDCGNDASLDITDAITIEAWVKRNSIGTWQIPVAKYLNTGAQRSWWFGFLADNTLKTIFAENGGATVWRQFTTSSTFVDTSNFYHIVATASASLDEYHIYVNGVDEAGTKAGTVGGISSIFASTGPLTIGREAHTTPAYFNGIIDEVRIYSRALTADEVYERYQRGL